MSPHTQQLAASTPRDLLSHVRSLAATVRSAEVGILVAACEWADAHPALPDDPEPYAADRTDAVAQQSAGWLGRREEFDVDDPDPSLPEIAWEADAPFAAALGLSTAAGAKLMREGLTLRHRLPRLWKRVLAGEVEVWRARRIAARAIGEPADVVAYLDQHATPHADTLGLARLDQVVDEAMLRLHAEERELDQLAQLDHRFATLHRETINHVGIAEMTLRGDWADLSDFDATLSEVAHAIGIHPDYPDQHGAPLDVRRARAIGILSDPALAQRILAGRPVSSPRRRIKLVIHLTPDHLTGSDPVVKADGDLAATLDPLVREWCGRRDTALTVSPVIDLTQPHESHSDDVSEILRERTALKHPTCAFPYCERTARSCDCDHVVARARGGPTSDPNLAPLCRRHHRLKTHSGWRYFALEPCVWIWTEPHGQRFLTDRHGTRDLTPAAIPPSSGYRPSAVPHEVAEDCGDGLRRRLRVRG